MADRDGAARSGSSDRPARLLIVNTVALNAGDAAILMGELHALRHAFGDGALIQVADDAPDTAARLYPDVDFVPGLHGGGTAEPGTLGRLRRSIEKRRVTRAIRLLRRSPDAAWKLLDDQARAQLTRMMAADAVIATGGTYLVEHYPLRNRTDELLAAQALGRPTFLYTQSLGPFRKRRNRRLIRRALRGVARIFLRDERSAAHLTELGVPDARLEVRPDAAFALAPVTSETPAGAEDLRAAPLRVAVSVRYWRRFGERAEEEGRELYRRSVADAVRGLVARGARVVFLSTCQGVDDYWTDDARYARELVDELLPGLEGVHVDPSFRRPAELLDELRNFDLAVATRMHFAILALAAGTPVVPIAYEFKTTELFHGLGMPALVQQIDTITPDSLRQRIEDALARRDELRNAIARQLPALRQGAMAPALRIRDGLGAGTAALDAGHAADADGRRAAPSNGGAA